MTDDERRDIRAEWVQAMCERAQDSGLDERRDLFGTLSETEWEFEPKDWTPVRLTIFRDLT